MVDHHCAACDVGRPRPLLRRACAVCVTTRMGRLPHRETVPPPSTSWRRPTRTPRGRSCTRPRGTAGCMWADSLGLAQGICGLTTTMTLPPSSWLDTCER
eukprot:scaffold14048_cov243-Isochrysis_galbana.AAC.1